jgi:hypothetical protein
VYGTNCPLEDEGKTFHRQSAKHPWPHCREKLKSYTGSAALSCPERCGLKDMSSGSFATTA